MTILQIGNNKHSGSFLSNKRRGFSFVEVMVTFAILSFGIVLIYRSFFLSLNYINHIAYRLYATTLLDNKIVLMQKLFESTKEIPFGEQQQAETGTINNKKITFYYNMNIEEISGLDNIYSLTASLAWNEGARDVSISRSSYIANYNVTKY